ncbi:alpha-hydroxy acid oxidase [Kribbia dieselivorans]|uniref:alpha-hydroxy acid oxidase n=1 Tax=Kribbia dieselivorans TaxID=331526 RepID=UPI000AE0ADA9|nr:alpha-hydroxy acid oxidase [Kribbia dieselivorans]
MNHPPNRPSLVESIRRAWEMVDLTPPPRDPVERALRRCLTIDDLRETARVRVPRPVFEFVDGAAGTEASRDRALAAFDRIHHHPGPLAATARVPIDLSTEIFGRRVALPLIMGPTGFTRMSHTDGELAVARAAAHAGIPYTLSTPATTSIEDVAAATPDADRWFQLYVLRDRARAVDLMARAAATGYRTLVVTVDTPTTGDRRRDTRNGFTIPARIRPRELLQIARHPGWATRFLRAEPLGLASFPIDGHGDMWQGLKAISGADFTFDEIAWVRERWDGPLVVKGILDADLARRAVELGADGVVVSNHGGRQLDRTVAPLDVLEPVAQAIGGQAAVFLDSGVREGSDIAAAIALGATAVLVGRPYLYGLMVGGERGAAHAIEIFRRGLDHHLRLLGVTSVGQLNRRHVTLAPAPHLNADRRERKVSL